MNMMQIDIKISIWIFIFYIITYILGYGTRKAVFKLQEHKHSPIKDNNKDT